MLGCIFLIVHNILAKLKPPWASRNKQTLPELQVTRATSNFRVSFHVIYCIQCIEEKKQFQFSHSYPSVIIEERAITTSTSCHETFDVQ